MKRLLKIFIICLFIIPLVVHGEEVSIKTSVSLEGEKLSDEQFTFVLKDKDGNILQTKKNDLNGDVIFDPITVEPSSLETNTFYTIHQVNDNKLGYSYDSNAVYVRVKSYNNEVNTYYYKDSYFEEKMKEEIPKYEYKEPYHATEEELRGEAYAVFDAQNDTVYFRRINSIEESNFGELFTSTSQETAWDNNNHLIYHRFIEESKDSFRAAFTYCNMINSVRHCPKKVIFEQPIKPEFNDGVSLFYSDTVEEMDLSLFDSSNITDMSSMFRSSKVKKLDLSNFDTKHVTTMYEMFSGSKVEELDLTSFDGSSLINIGYMFYASNELHTLKISDQFRSDKLLLADMAFLGTSKLELLDMSGIMINGKTSASNIFKGSGLKYLDLSHWNFENGVERNSVFANSFYDMDNLIYVDLSNLTSPLCGAYGSSDFGFKDSVQVIKLSNQYNSVRHMTLDYNVGFFNTNLNDFTYELSEHIDSACRYYTGGSYLNISLDESASYFRNSYEKVVMPDNIVNPETGNSIMFVLILLFVIFGLYWSRKRELS